jgi:hypothetical protein
LSLLVLLVLAVKRTEERDMVTWLREFRQKETALFKRQVGTFW